MNTQTLTNKQPRRQQLCEVLAPAPQKQTPRWLHGCHLLPSPASAPRQWRRSYCQTSYQHPRPHRLKPQRWLRPVVCRLTRTQRVPVPVPVPEQGQVQGQVRVRVQGQVQGQARVPVQV